MAVSPSAAAVVNHFFIGVYLENKHIQLYPKGALLSKKKLHFSLRDKAHKKSEGIFLTCFFFAIR